jgi:uncharacterized protein (TIGR03437 family)
MIDAFDFTQQPRPPVLLNASGSAYPPAAQTQVYPAGTLHTINSAYGTYALAPETIASIYGSNLAAGVQQAQSQNLPATLLGVSVTLKDSTGSVFPASLFYVSTDQVNFLVPKGAANGPGTLTLTNGAATFTGTALLSAVAPGLYITNQTGQGPAAAQVVNPQGIYTNTSQCSATGCTLVPIDLSGPSPLYLVLYGTGIRGAAQANVSVKVGNVDAPVIYAGPQGYYPGLDQVNTQLPSALKGRGQLVVTITANGQATNMGQLLFK